MPSRKSDGYLPPLREPHKDKVEYLAANGYFEGDMPDADKLSEKDTLFRNATLAFQELAGLLPDGNFGPQSIRRTHDKCCALPDLNHGFVRKGNGWAEFSIEEACTRKWATKNLTCTHNLSHSAMSKEEIHKAWWEAKVEWMKVCGIVFKHVPYDGARSANFVHSMERMDGSSGKLAYHYLPNCGQPAGSTLVGRFDSGERWSFNFFKAVSGHEDGHGLGLGHDSNRNALLYPYYQRNVIVPTARDAKRVQDRYGKPTTPPTDPGTPGPGIPRTLEQRVLQNELDISINRQLIEMLMSERR